MLRRLLLALLTLCLALPATAMPVSLHQDPAVAVTNHHQHGHEMPVQDPSHHDSTAKHECIGCIAPLAGIGQAPEPPMLIGTPRLPTLARQLLGTVLLPETPPPRNLP